MDMEARALFSYLRKTLLLGKKQRKKRIGRVLFLIDKTIEEASKDPFISRFFWEEFRNILVDVREVIKNPKRKKRLSKNIEEIRGEIEERK